MAPKKIMQVIVVGLCFAGIMGLFSTSKLPPCALSAKGMGITTYGCTSTTPASYACANYISNSAPMRNCVEHNYYLIKTIPFGFTQYFNTTHNEKTPNDSTVINENRVASFVLGVVLAVLFMLYVLPAIRKTRQAQPQQAGSQDADSPEDIPVGLEQEPKRRQPI